MKAICHTMLLITLAGKFCATAAETASPDPYANETKEQHDARMAWWREAKFGMFIHWGVYAVPAGFHQGKPVNGIGEWIMIRGKIPVADYKAFAPDFTASKYDPESWADLAKRAGMRYVIVTAKHHDGFALFDSRASDWNAVASSGAKRDLIAPLATAARDKGLKFGLYYSQAQDWTHPGGAKSGYNEGESWDEANKGDFDHYLQTVTEPQVQEILSRYEPDVLWWDTPTWMNKQRADRLMPSLKLVPGIIHNNRLGGGYQGDTDTPEQHIPATGFRDRDWEVCMTMNDTWGYKSADHNWKSVETLIHQLCDIVSKGGNFLLNIGPTAEGEIPQPSIERLEAIGRWMDVNHEAIYGTTASPFHKLPWGRCTKKVSENAATLYLHVFDWPQDGKLFLPGLKNSVSSASLLADATHVPASAADNGVTLTLPATAPDAIASVIKLELIGDLVVDPIALRQDATGTIALDTKFAELNNPGYGAHLRIESANGTPHIGYWTDHRAWVQWTFTVTKPGKFHVETDIASDGTTAFQWGVDESMQNTSVNTSGGFGNFRSVKLGTVTIDTPGTHTLSLKPEESDWKPVNVRSLTLKPAD